MAFHVACPLTCKKICTCSLGGAAALRKLAGKEAFVQNALALQKLLTKSPLMITTGDDMVEVLVPRLSKELKKKKRKPAAEKSAIVSDAEAPEAAEAEAEVTPERLEDAVVGEQVEANTGEESAQLDATVHTPDVEPAENLVEEATSSLLPPPPEETPVSTTEAACGICVENEKTGTRRYERMLICGGCGRRFHRKCLKPWASHRDLFNWASWRCLHCRTCEDCKVTGDANRLLFCKRCDEAHHANCKQTGAKAPLRGPYLCPKHVQCHSCGTRVPGGGPSSRWFHAYLFCDACGRLFLKNKYCPLCLKVYRESEPTPMVCCDKCEHWVHCVCEKISDEKYQEFHVNQNLRFTCAACRGDSFQCKSVDDAVGELWRRKDEADRDQISKLRAAAGLPSEEEMARLCPSSDDEGKEQPPPQKEGRLVIKLKKSTTEQKGVATKGAKTPKRGGKSKHAPNDSIDGEKIQDGDESHKKSKRKRHASEDGQTQSGPPAKVLRVRGPGEASGNKITLRVPTKVLEDNQGSASASEATRTVTKEDEDEHSEEHVQSQADSRVRKDSAATETNEESTRKRAKSTQEPQTELKSVKLKFRRQSGVEGEVSKGQRSKRKRPSAPAEDEAPVEDPDTDEDDHTSILQRLGTDAVSKRVEVRQADQTWIKGTITAVNQRRAQITIHYDNGTHKVQKYGTQKLRLLGNR